MLLILYTIILNTINEAGDISYSSSSLDHGNFEWFGRKGEAVHRIIPDLNSRLEADIKPLEDVCQGQKYQGPSEFLSQTSSLADLSSKNCIIP